MNVQNKQIGPRTLMTIDGEPVPVSLVMRQSSTAPSRIKCILAITVEAEDGEMGIAPLPFAVPVVTVDGKKPRGFTPEFRLEMN